MTGVLIYLNNSVLARLTDELSQHRVREENLAVRRILSAVQEGRVTWVPSIASLQEASSIQEQGMREDRLALIGTASAILRSDESCELRAKALERLGFGGGDALHIAYAEHARAELFITTDDRLLRLAARTLRQGSLSFLNPVDWMPE